MYKVIGADGKEYGPVNLEQLQGWIAAGRVNAGTRVQAVGSSEWQAAAEFPDIAALLVPPIPVASARSATPPAIGPLPTGSKQSDGLAITSFVLGLVSIVLCLGPFAGIPAVICGHIARSHTKKLGLERSGSGLALPGLILGYLGIAIVLLLAPALLLPALAKAKSRASTIACASNMKQLGLAFQMWASEHDGKFPFEVSEGAGGTSEARQTGPDGFDANAAKHLAALANYLGTPVVLVCPADKMRHPASELANLQSGNVTYKLRTGPEVTMTNSTEVLLVCPIHGNSLHCDGSVQTERRPGSARFGSPRTRPRRL